MMYQHRSELRKTWSGIMWGLVLSTFLHFAFFPFSASYVFSGLATTVEYVFFFYDAIYWVFSIGMVLSLAGRKGVALIIGLILPLFAITGVINNSIGIMNSTRYWGERFAVGLVCEVDIWIMIIIMIWALLQSLLALIVMIVAQRDSLNPRYKPMEIQQPLYNGQGWPGNQNNYHGNPSNYPGTSYNHPAAYSQVPSAPIYPPHSSHNYSQPANPPYGQGQPYYGHSQPYGQTQSPFDPAAPYNPGQLSSSNGYAT